MLRDEWIGSGAILAQGLSRIRFVEPHQPAVADHIGSEDGRETTGRGYGDGRPPGRRSSEAADAPAVHHYAEKRHGDGRKDAAKRQRERGRTAMSAHSLTERLQKHAKSEAQHRKVADQQAGDRTEHHPPRVCELFATSPPASHTMELLRRSALLSESPAESIPYTAEFHKGRQGLDSPPRLLIGY